MRAGPRDVAQPGIVITQAGTDPDVAGKLSVKAILLGRWNDDLAMVYTLTLDLFSRDEFMVPSGLKLFK